jgi:hypothetical protein
MISFNAGASAMSTHTTKTSFGRAPFSAVSSRLAVLLLAGLASWSPVQAADVGVSVSVSQPGVYGRVDIGKFPQPAVVVQRPIIVQAAPQPVAVQPVYMWVPPGHRKNWRKHCRAYNACGQQVYFVRDDWYHQHVMRPQENRYDDERGHGHGRGHDKKEHGHGHGRGHDR